MVLDGIQGWIEHNADEAQRLSESEPDPEIAAHLRHLVRAQPQDRAREARDV